MKHSTSNTSPIRLGHPRGRGEEGGGLASGVSAESGPGGGAATGAWDERWGKRNQGSPWVSLTTTNPVAEEHSVASRVVPTIQVGFFEPLAAKTAMAVTGINWTEPVLMARKVHIALLAVSGCGFNP